MDREELKKSVLINLRCVTQSSKVGVPLNQLQREYKDLLGSEIPVKDLGYSSLEQFLHSIPDVICLKRNKEGTLTAEGLADASTAHIASLISRQKTSKKSKSKSGRPSVLTRKWGSSVKVTPQENQKPFFHNLSASTCSKTRRQNSETAELNPEQNELKKSVLINLRSVVQSSKCGVPLSHLQRDYRKFIGTIIPFKYLGYNSLEEFIQGIPEVINLKKDVNGECVAVAVPDATTAHLFNLELNQEPTKTKTLKAKVSPKCIAENAAAIQISSQMNTEVSTTFKATQNSVEASKVNNLLKEPSMKSALTTHDINQYVGKAVQLSKCETTKENKQEKDKVLKTLVLEYLKSMIKNSGGSLPLSMIPSIYKHDVGSNIPFAIFGFNSLENFIRSLSSDFNLKKNKNGELLVEIVFKTTKECVNIPALDKEPKSVEPHTQIQPKYVPPMFRSKISPPTTSVPEVSSSSMIYIPPPLRNKLQNEVTKSATHTVKSASTLPTTHSLPHLEGQTKNQDCISESRKSEMVKKSGSVFSSSSICDSMVLKNVANKVEHFKTSRSSSSTDVSNVQLSVKEPCDIVTPKRRTRRGKRKRVAELQAQEASSKDSAEEDNGVFTAYCDALETLHVTRGSSHPLAPYQSVFSVSDLESLKSNNDSVISSSVEENSETGFQDLNEHWSVKTEEYETTSFEENITIKNNISKASLSELIHLHFLLFGDSKKTALKKEIESFSGFPYGKDSKEWKQKENLLLQLPVPILKCCVKSLGIQFDEEDDSILLPCKLIEFLECRAKALVVKGADHSTLLHLHFIVSGVLNPESLRKRILSFTGFPFSKASHRWTNKVKFAKRCPLHMLQQCLTLICIQYDYVDDRIALLLKLEQFLQAHTGPVEKDFSNLNLGALLHLHFLLYGVSSMDTLQKEISSFTGFPFCADSEDWKEKLSLMSKLSKKTLKQCLTILRIEHNVLDDDKRLLSKLENHLGAYTKIKNTNNE